MQLSFMWLALSGAEIEATRAQLWTRVSQTILHFKAVWSSAEEIASCRPTRLPCHDKAKLAGDSLPSAGAILKGRLLQMSHDRDDGATLDCAMAADGLKTRLTNRELLPQPVDSMLNFSSNYAAYSLQQPILL